MNKVVLIMENTLNPSGIFIDRGAITWLDFPIPVIKKGAYNEFIGKVTGIQRENDLIIGNIEVAYYAPNIEHINFDTLSVWFSNINLNENNHLTSAIIRGVTVWDLRLKVT